MVSSRFITFSITLSVIAFAIIFASTTKTTKTFEYSRMKRLFSLFSSKTTMKMTTTSKTPVYFLAHGGPNIIYDTEHPVYTKLHGIGKEIIQVVKPKAVVVISAHWESSIPGVIEINSAEDTDLIYDFYGFPKHYYSHKYPNKGSPSLAKTIQSTLCAAGLPSKPTKRGLDHGVFASFSVAFPPSSPTSLFPTIPIVQISLPFSSTSPTSYFALGKALSPLRDQGVIIIASGMAVHNLRGLSFPLGEPRKYTTDFDEALRAAVEDCGGEGREEKMSALLERKDCKLAHPSLEHLWPVFVAAGASGVEEKGVRIWTKGEGSMSWSMFRFGEVRDRDGYLF